MPRSTRAPRKPSPFRISSTLALCCSQHLRDRLQSLPPNNLTPTSPARVNLSRVIRNALRDHGPQAQAIRNLRVPDAFLPPADYAQRVNLTVAIPDPQDRDLYEAQARNHGLTTTEFMLRCVTLYLNTTKPNEPNEPTQPATNEPTT